MSRLDGLSARSAKAEAEEDEGEEGRRGRRWAAAAAAASGPLSSSGMAGRAAQLGEGDGPVWQPEWPPRPRGEGTARLSSLWPERRWRKARAPPAVRLCKHSTRVEEYFAYELEGGLSNT